MASAGAIPCTPGLQRWVRDLNTLYRGEPALHELDCDAAGFEWVDCKDSQRSVISFLRRGSNPNDQLLLRLQFHAGRRDKIIAWACRWDGYWKEILNSDAPLYGGSGQGNFGGCRSESAARFTGGPFSLNMTLPPSEWSFSSRELQRHMTLEEERSWQSSPAAHRILSGTRTRIIYELHVRAFKDSNADGIGDFPGLIQKLDYLQDLGVTCLWLLPSFLRR